MVHSHTAKAKATSAAKNPRSKPCPVGAPLTSSVGPPLKRDNGGAGRRRRLEGERSGASSLPVMVNQTDTITVPAMWCASTARSRISSNRCRLLTRLKRKGGVTEGKSEDRQIDLAQEIDPHGSSGDDSEVRTTICWPPPPNSSPLRHSVHSTPPQLNRSAASKGTLL
jgi:hypothetical protein